MYALVLPRVALSVLIAVGVWTKVLAGVWWSCTFVPVVVIRIMVAAFVFT